MPGRSVKQAFEIGQQIVEAVTRSNPAPIELKLEKVYHPCLLMEKKRYVGLKYSSANDTQPVIESKGIETIRRDTCPAVSKMLEKTLKLLFIDKDLSRIKQYVQRQWTKLLNGRVPLNELIFAKEVRLGGYSDKISPPPAAVVAMKRMEKDPRAVPQYGERIGYVVVFGEPNARLVDMVMSPEEYMASSTAQINTIYYISKQIIPALERVLNLVGVDVRSWFSELPRFQRIKRFVPSELAVAAERKRTTIDQYYQSMHCIVCQSLCSDGLCSGCLDDLQTSSFVISSSLANQTRQLKHLQEICFDCSATSDRDPSILECSSLDCVIFFRKHKLIQQVQLLQHFDQLLINQSK